MSAVQVNHAVLERLRERSISFVIKGDERLQIGDTLTFDENGFAEPYCAILAGTRLPTIGSFSYTWSDFPQGVKIGRYCSLSWNIRVMAENHSLAFISTSSFVHEEKFVIFANALRDKGVSNFPRYPRTGERADRSRLPEIRDDVWIGQDVLLARGITLNTGCAVAAGSVVTRSVPPYAIVGGNPAKIIRYRFDEEVISGLLASQWWEYNYVDFADLRYDQPAEFIETFGPLRDSGSLQRLLDKRIRYIDLFDDVVS